MNTNTHHGTARTVGVLGAAIATCLFAATAFGATTYGELPSKVVNIEDLDLSQPAHAAKLYSRIRRAAQLVCGQFEGPGAAQHVQWNRCVKESTANAVAKLDLPSLNQIHFARNNGGKAHAAAVPAS